MRCAISTRINRIAALFTCAWMIASGFAHAQKPAPVMDYVSILDCLDVNHRDGRLRLHFDDKLVAAFVAPAADIDVVFAKTGESTPVHVAPQKVYRVHGVFSEIVSLGNAEEFRFTEPGEYTATFRVDGKPVTIVPFSVMFKNNGDAFQPKTFAYLNGPWEDHGFLVMPLNKSKPAEFRTWARVVSFTEGRDAAKFSAEIRKEGDVIANGGDSYTSTQEWQSFQFKLRFPKDKGGEYMRSEQLLARGDGIYHVVMKRNDALHSVWEFQVKDGKPVPHPRQDAAHEPRSEYVLPRFAAIYDGGESAGDTTWMKRLSADAAQVIFHGRSAAVEGPDESTIRQWSWQPSSDPTRPIRFVVSDVKTRSDTTIRAGDDLIVFGTDYPSGVSYMHIGDTKPRSIPYGETFSSKVFQVCGRKIVLVNKNTVAVYDTKTENLVRIPESDIFLSDVRGGLHTSNLINSDGYLVVTVNDVSKVTDRTSIKLIDVSGENPHVVSVKNAGYSHRDVSSVAVDASQGLVAVSSRQQRSIYVAKAARLANQLQFELDEYKGISDDQIFIGENAIVYADTEDKLRILPLDGGHPVALTDEGMGASSNGFFFAHGRVAIATRNHYGSRFPFAISDIPNSPTLLKETGTKIKGTSGGLGMAGIAAIAPDKTVFLAGTDSIGVGEHLQVLDQEKSVWLPVANENGEVLNASDVSASKRLIAFKSADQDGRTTVGYATFGEKIDVSQIPVQGEHPGKSREPSTARSDKPADSSSPYYTKNQLELDYIVGYVQSEKQMGDAFAGAFGEKEGRKKARDAVLDVMKQNNHSHLIRGFLKMVGEQK